jgi:hypothetical protein
MSILFYIILFVSTAIFIAYVKSLFSKKSQLFYYNDNGDKGYFGFLRKVTNNNYLHSVNKTIFQDSKVGNVKDESGVAIINQRKYGSDQYAYNEGDKKGTVDSNGDIKDLKGDTIAHCDPIGQRWFGLLSNILPAIILLTLWSVSSFFTGFGLFSNNQNSILLYIGCGYLFFGLIISYFTFSTEIFITDSSFKPTIVKLGATVELRFSKTSEINQMTKAAGCLALYEEDALAYEKDAGVLPSMSAKDLAFPAMLIYVILFSVFSNLFLHYQLSPAMGAIISYNVSMVLIYTLIWWLLLMIKTDLGNQNNTFMPLLQLINRNTGIKGWNTFLILVSAIGMAFTLFINVGAGGYVLFPLFLVIFFATFYNSVVSPGQPWQINNTLSDIIKPAQQTRRVRNQVQPITGKTVNLEFNWDLSKVDGLGSSEIIKITAQVNENDFIAPEFNIRKQNPFFGKDASGKPNWKKAWKFDDQNPSIATINTVEFNEMISKVLKYSDLSQENIVQSIINACNEVVQRNNLPSYELFNLITNFCQYQINYKLDADSTTFAETAEEYVRLPIETLFDKAGDCDCYAALSYKIFSSLNLGVDDVKYGYINTSGTEKHAFLLLKKDCAIPLSPNINAQKDINGLNGEYVFCEVTARGWSIGENNNYDLQKINIIN